MATDDMVPLSDLTGLAATAPSFIQTNLISDGSVPGTMVDPNLKNGWGISFPPTGPFWISNQVTGTTSIDTITGANVTVNVIPPVTVPSPTGQVFNSLGNAFVLPNGQPATFLFASTTGAIYGWNAGTSAVLAVTSPTPAAYTGLSIGMSNAGPTLYAANNRAGTVDMYDTTFKLIKTFAPDPGIPAGFGPYNVEVVNGAAYVTYSHQDRTTGPGVGFVDKYDLNGNLLGRVASGGTLDAPWGLAIAPATFGSFANDLLVGNFGDGTINAFDPINNTFLGQLTGADGTPIKIDGLWALTPGNGTAAGDKNTLYFSAGPVSETHGLFGSLIAAPPPM